MRRDTGQNALFILNIVSSLNIECLVKYSIVSNFFYNLKEGINAGIISVITTGVFYMYRQFLCFPYAVTSETKIFY